MSIDSFYCEITDGLWVWTTTFLDLAEFDDRREFDTELFDVSNLFVKFKGCFDLLLDFELLFELLLFMELLLLFVGVTKANF